MSLDERIEALTRNMELLSRTHEGNQKVFARLVNQLFGATESPEVRIGDLEESSDRAAETLQVS